MNTAKMIRSTNQQINIIMLTYLG